LQKLERVGWNGITGLMKLPGQITVSKALGFRPMLLVQKMAASKTEAELLKAYSQLSNEIL